MIWGYPYFWKHPYKTNIETQNWWFAACRCTSFFKGNIFRFQPSVFETVDCHSPSRPLCHSTNLHANKHKSPLETPEFQCTKHHHAKHPMSHEWVWFWSTPPPRMPVTCLQVHRNSLLTKNGIILVVTVTGWFQVWSSFPAQMLSINKLI